MVATCRPRQKGCLHRWDRPIRDAGDYRMAKPGMVGDSRGMRVDLSNTSDVTGRPEVIALYTALLPDGHLFYTVAVAPQDEFDRYEATFNKVVASLRLQSHR